MEQDEARRLASEYIRADPGAAEAYQVLGAAITALLPDIDAGAVVEFNGESTLVGVAGTTVFTVHVEGSAPEARVVTARTVSKEEASVSCEQTIGQPGPLARRRVWTISLSDDEPQMMIETHQVMRGGFPDERAPTSKESLARAREPPDGPSQSTIRARAFSKARGATGPVASFPPSAGPVAPLRANKCSQDS